MSELILDVTALDPAAALYGPEDIRKINPHRYEMELLDRVIYIDREQTIGVGVKQVRETEFWTRGHFPDGAIFPGVLIVEAAAQLGSFVSKTLVEDPRRMVFGAAQRLRFRGMVRPGDDLVLVARLNGIRRTASRFDSQAFVDGKMVFEGEILGMLV